MSESESQQSAQKPEIARFQFSLRTMLLLFVVLGASLGVFGTAGIVVFVFTVALAVDIQRAKSPFSPSIVLPAVICVIIFILAMLPNIEEAREASRIRKCLNEMRQLGLALLSYEKANGRLPPAYIADKNGTPMHSWRVLILPYMEFAALYKTYDFTEPWIGPKNKNLRLTKRMWTYQCQ